MEVIFGGLFGFVLVGLVGHGDGQAEEEEEKREEGSLGWEGRQFGG